MRRPAVPTEGSPADELLKLADLKERGLLTEEEFAKAQQKVLGA
jgi:hypothetical protein